MRKQINPSYAGAVVVTICTLICAAGLMIMIAAPQLEMMSH